jgi:crotonobetaine/carnitine-CoA ligase
LTSVETLAQLITRQASERPDEVFLMFEDETFNFADLEQRVRRYASSLSEFGIRRGDRIGLMMRNHPDHIFLYLALSWLGATNVEYSIHLKQAGLEIQLEDAEPRFIFADSVFANELDLAAKILPTLENIIWFGDGYPASSLAVSSNTILDNLPVTDAVSIHDFDRIQTISYTSGTTGKPKGVMLSERWFQIGAKNAGLLADIRQDDVIFLWEPFFHIAGWMSVLMSLQHGVPIAMVAQFSGSKCWDQIRRYRATLLHYLGGAMNILLKQPARPDDRDNPVRVAWGAAAPSQSWCEFEHRFGLTVHEGYGISEAQNLTHINIGGPVGSIGKPVTEFDCLIEAEDASLQPPGKIGEIVLKPSQPNIIMAGYFRDEKRTAETLQNGCVYTGDIGYQDDDGYFYFSGRQKDSLRHRGENVSAWEVERVVNAHPAVEESAVIGVPSPMGEQDIKVFLKLVDNKSLNPIELIKWCEQQLAYYQVPRFIEFVADFPRGPTQRIRKSELPTSVHGNWDLEQSGHKIRNNNT